MQVRRNTDFTGWPSVEGQTGSQHALEGKTMEGYMFNFDTSAQVFEVFTEDHEYVGCGDTKAEAIEIAKRHQENGDI